MNQFEAWIARQRRRLSLGVFLTAFADAMAVFLLVFGSSVLLVKLAASRDVARRAVAGRAGRSADVRRLVV